MGAFAKIRGTMESLFSFGGTGGPQAKRVTDALHIRNAADAAFAELHADVRHLGFAPVYGMRLIDAAPSANQNNYSPTDWTTPDTVHRYLRLTPTADIVITGLADGTDGDLATITNQTDDYLIILSDESSSSTAANQFATRQPIFLVGRASITLMYFQSRWRPISSSGGVSFGAFFDVYEEYLGNIGSTAGVVSGTGASVQASTYLQNTTERPFGVWQADTGTTATGRANLGGQANGTILPAQGRAIYLTRLAVEALSSGTERYQIFAGFHDAVGGTNVTDGVYWVYRDDVSALWQGGVGAAGVRVENFAAGPTVDTNYIWLGIYLNQAWTRASYFYSTTSVDWVFAGSRSTGLPSASQAFGFGNTINKTVGTTQRNLSVDMIGMRYDTLRG